MTENSVKRRQHQTHHNSTSSACLSRWFQHIQDVRLLHNHTNLVIRLLKSLSSPSSSSNLLVKVREISVLARWLRALSLLGSLGSTAPSPEVKKCGSFIVKYVTFLHSSQKHVRYMTVPSNASLSGTSLRSCSSSCNKSFESGEMASRCSKSNCKDTCDQSSVKASDIVKFVTVTYCDSIKSSESDIYFTLASASVRPAHVNKCRTQFTTE